MLLSGPQILGPTKTDIFELNFSDSDATIRSDYCHADFSIV